MNDDESLAYSLRFIFKETCSTQNIKTFLVGLPSATAEFVIID
jgi:hypothetical protein